MRNLYISFVTLGVGLALQAQEARQISGSVLDEKGQPLIGVQIQVIGATHIGGLTDVNGDFRLQVPQSARELLFSYVGFQKLVVRLNDKKTFKVILKEELTQLNELVVTGYGGKVRRNKVTNSISSIKGELLTSGGYVNPAQALSGAVSGLKISQYSGDPSAMPSITLRGGTNFNGLASNAPLIIIDGQPRSSMDGINPDDIEDIQVLKDAGATALYGARASNGIILITTKGGKVGRGKLSLKIKRGWNFYQPDLNLLNTEQYISTQRRAYQDLSQLGGQMTNFANGLSEATSYGTGNTYGGLYNIMSYKGTAEQDDLLAQGWRLMEDPLNKGAQLIYRGMRVRDYSLQTPSLSEDYNLNFEGGNDKGTYYAGLGYNRSEGAPINSYYKRLSFLLNGSYKIKPWLKSISNFSFNKVNNQSLPALAVSENAYFGSLQFVAPTTRFEDERGRYSLGETASEGNFLYQTEQFSRLNQSDKFTMVQSFELDLLKSLSLKVTGNWLYNEHLEEAFNKDYEETQGVYNRTRLTSADFRRQLVQTYTTVLNYSPTFRSHALSLMLGSEYLDDYTYTLSAAGEGAPTDDYADLELTSSGEGKRKIDTSHERYRVLSFFGRANYDFLSRYLLSFVFRYDGYSALLGKNRWGFFPGVSAGWILSNERFFKDNVRFMSFAKLRVSYGVNGNASNIQAYTLQGEYGTGDKYVGNTTTSLKRLPNPNLLWEQTTTRELGLDLGFFQNRLNLAFSYYTRYTSDQHSSQKLATSSGFANILSNNGLLRNRGLELELSAKLLTLRDWNWTVNANISYNRNRILQLPENGRENNRIGGTRVYTGRGRDVRYVGGLQEGHEPGRIAVYRYDGVYRSLSEIPENLVVMPIAGYQYTLYGPKAYAALSDRQKTTALPLKVGDAKWYDVNNDGVIDQFDQVELGGTIPRWTGGFNTTLSYKSWQLYLRADFSLGFWVRDDLTARMMGNVDGNYNTTLLVDKTYSEHNLSGVYPRYLPYNVKMNYRPSSSLFAYRGDYLALRELTLSYSLPKAWTKKIFMEQVSLSITGQNLAYLSAATKTMSNPEVSTYFDGSGRYPLPITLLMGLNVTF